MPKTLTWESCGACPFVQKFNAGRHHACGHQKTIYLKPYSNQRYVNPDEISKECPV